MHGKRAAPPRASALGAIDLPVLPSSASATTYAAAHTADAVSLCLDPSPAPIDAAQLHVATRCARVSDSSLTPPPFRARVMETARAICWACTEP